MPDPRPHFPPPKPAYDPIPVNKAFYASIANTATTPDGRTTAQSFTIPIRSAKAWTVKAGQVCRLSTPEGPQVGDLNIWSLHNPRERFWAARTRQLQSSHVKVYDALWSNLPYLRKLVTVVAVLSLQIRKKCLMLRISGLTFWIRHVEIWRPCS